VLDGDTQQRFARETSLARPPSWRELRLAVDRIAAQVARDRQDGKSPVVFLFFSGHGLIRKEAGAALALQDGLQIDLRPLLGETYQRVARPIAFSVGEALACVELNVRTIETGPNVLAGGFEKDVALTGAFAHDGYLRLYVQASGQAAAYLPCPDAAVTQPTP